MGFDAEWIRQLPVVAAPWVGLAVTVNTSYLAAGSGLAEEGGGGGGGAAGDLELEAAREMSLSVAGVLFLIRSWRWVVPLPT
jgi:hypothetical protein